MKVTNTEFKCQGTPVLQVKQCTVKYSPLFYFRPNLPAFWKYYFSWKKKPQSCQANFPAVIWLKYCRYGVKYSINRSIQANLSNYHNNSMFEWSKDNIEQNNKDKKHMYSTTKVIYICLSYFTETHSLVVHYSLRETVFTTQRSQLLSRQKHGQYKQIDRRKTIFKGD